MTYLKMAMKITVVISQATEKMTTVFTQNDNIAQLVRIFIFFSA